MFDCVLENTIGNPFSTYCFHFLTFSQLPNEYIISFILKNTNKSQKRSHFLGDRDRNLADLDREIAIGAIVIAPAIDASREIGEIAIARSVDGDRDRRFA